MNVVLKILTGLWITFWLWFAFEILITTPLQIQKDTDFINNEIKPAVNYVKIFKRNHQRLPTEQEFSDFGKQHNIYAEYIRLKNQIPIDDYSKVKDADWSKDFAIAAWRGEWMEYYFSWTNNYDSNNYSWSDGFIGFGITSGIGIFPLLFLWFKILRRRGISQKFIEN